jgi:hypothetical protein
MSKDKIKNSLAPLKARASGMPQKVANFIMSKPGKAINVYDGQAFNRVIEYYSKKNHVDVKIITAKYGLLDKDDKIDPYDVKMTNRSFALYKEALAHTLCEIVGGYRDVFLYGGKLYLMVMPEGISFRTSEGKIRQQFSQLKEWLNEGRGSKITKLNKNLQLTITETPIVARLFKIGLNSFILDRMLRIVNLQKMIVCLRLVLGANNWFHIIKTNNRLSFNDAFDRSYIRYFINETTLS